MDMFLRVSPVALVRSMVGLAMVMVFLAACGGGSTDPVTLSAPPPTAVTIAPTQVPIDIPPTAVAPTTPATPTQAAQTGTLEEQIAAGKILYEKTASGVGCALCHGIDGKGDPLYAAPSNRGATADQILDAIETRPQMAFLVLSNDEVQAIAAYLKVLAEQP